MANINTVKDVVLLNDPNPNFINFAINDGHVVIAVKNESVTHRCIIDPNEAIKMGVMLIQLAAGAGAQRQQKLIAQKANGIVSKG